MARTPRTLRGQLTALFLVLTLVPAVLVTAVATHRLFAALSRWSSPEVQRALSQSLVMSKELLARTKNDLRQRGQLLAADPVLEGAPDTVAVRRRLAGSYNLDFMQLYDPDGTLRFQLARDPAIAAPGPFAGVDTVAAGSGFVPEGAGDLLAYAGYVGSPGESESILVVGIYLESGFYARGADLARGVAYYQKLPLIISLNQRLVLVFLGGLLLLLALGSVWIARRLAARVSRPVERLGHGMERVARGEEAVHVAPEGTEEMERLIATFNAMSGELSRSRGELARAERLAAWREAARRVAHEIKNALTPITFAVHRLRKSAPAELAGEERDRFDRSLETVLEEVEGLRRLASSFSELARLPVVELAPVDLRELARGVVAAHASDQRRWKVSLPETPVTVQGDRTLLRQALSNLVKNAVEATGPDATIWVTLAPEAGRALFTVEDDGPGWADGLKERALEPYVTTKAEGTGLGLSLVQRTVFQHGGSLELDERPGGGARVRVVLPLPGTKEER
jgi:nitrogen fixation/metabolism regulation signal transduction histidine kinase